MTELQPYDFIQFKQDDHELIGIIEQILPNNKYEVAMKLHSNSDNSDFTQKLIVSEDEIEPLEIDQKKLHRKVRKK